MPDEREVRRLLLDLARRRGPDKTFCPSEAARCLGDDWRDLMPLVRHCAGALQKVGRLGGFQGGRSVDLSGARGPVRLGLPRL